MMTQSAAAIAARVDRVGCDDEERVERLIRRLPDRLQKAAAWLRRPSSRWIRIPAAVLLIVGGCLSALPVFGLWMLPLGVILLAEDVRRARQIRDRLLAFIERRWPHWFVANDRDGPRL